MIILFGGGSVSCFFRLGLSMGCSELEASVKSLRSSAVFGGRLRRPSPCRIRSAPRRERGQTLSETSEKCVFFFNFGRYTPELFLDLAYVELERINKGQHFQIGIISKLASFPNWHHFQSGI